MDLESHPARGDGLVNIYTKLFISFSTPTAIFTDHLWKGTYRKINCNNQWST